MSIDRIRQLGQEMINRRRLMGLGAGAAASLAFGGMSVLSPDEVSAARLNLQDLAEVPRNRTMILVGNGGEEPNTYPDVENQNPYIQTNNTRSGWQLCYEPLAFYSMLTGEDKPWLGES